MTAPGPVTKLQRSFAYRLSKWFPSEMVRWMDLVSSELDGGGGIVNSVTGTAPIVVSAGVNPVVSLNPITDTNVAVGAAIAPAKLSNSAAPNGDVLQLVAGVPTWGLPGASAFTPTTPALWNPAPTTVGGALDESALLRTEFIFRPTEPSPSGNVFATWPALYAAALATPGPKDIVFDDSLAACAIPVGAYDFGKGCRWRGLMPGANSASVLRVSVTCPNGVTFTTPLYSIQDINLTYSGVGALMTVPAGLRFNFYLLGNAVATASGAAGRIFEVAGTSGISIFLFQQSFVSVSGGGFLWNTAGTGVCVINTSGSTFNPPLTASRLPANSLSGAAGPTYQFVADVPGMLSPAQASMPGGVIVVAVESPNIRMTNFTDAAQAITFPTNASDGGINIYDMTPTSTRIITINPPTIKGTIVEIINLGAVDMTLTFASAGPATPAAQSYIQGLSRVKLVWNGTAWDVDSPQVQRGGIALTNGVSAFIPADIVGGDIITTGLLTWNGASGILQQFGFVNGTKAGGGGFQLKSVTQAAGATVATDQGTYSWHIVH